MPDSFVTEPVQTRSRFPLPAASGLPAETVKQWKRRGFSALPDALAEHRFPKTGYEAKRACRALIDWLKEQGAVKPGAAMAPLIPWLLEFWTPESEYARHKRLVEKAILKEDLTAEQRKEIAEQEKEERLAGLTAGEKGGDRISEIDGELAAIDRETSARSAREILLHYAQSSDMNGRAVETIENAEAKAEALRQERAEQILIAGK